MKHHHLKNRRSVNLNLLCPVPQHSSLFSTGVLGDEMRRLFTLVIFQKLPCHRYIFSALSGTPHPFGRFKVTCYVHGSASDCTLAIPARFDSDMHLDYESFI